MVKVPGGMTTISGQVGQSEKTAPLARVTDSAGSITGQLISRARDEERASRLMVSTWKQPGLGLASLPNPATGRGP